ncbi:hypothetical protein AB7185_22135 [Providencia rettgeri]|uniref:hypothetical protein n=1 Tax=Providencia manganoxydans TaxID=2923283 RepID=UPI0034E40240
MKISKGLLSLISYACLIISFPVIAKTNTSLVSPKKGVICDQYICVVVAPVKPVHLAS